MPSHLSSLECLGTAVVAYEKWSAFCLLAHLLSMHRLSCSPREKRDGG